MRCFKKIVQWMTSMKLALLSLTLIALFAVPATMIPQGQNLEFYLENYNSRLSSIILFTGYDHFFRSIIFLILVLIFALNLLSCTIKRVTKQFKVKKKRFGPDIIHIGLLFLIAGGLVSFYTLEEGSLYLSEGDSILLPSQRYLTLDQFIFKRYPDGRPESWTAKVCIREDLNRTGGESFEIRVNKPLGIDGLMIYQSSYQVDRKRVGHYQAGFLLSFDPGKKYILISIITLFIGFLLTFIQKRERL